MGGWWRATVNGGGARWSSAGRTLRDGRQAAEGRGEVVVHARFQSKRRGGRGFLGRGDRRPVLAAGIGGGWRRRLCCSVERGAAGE
uniref:Uncharacterized protein n=1 Tax=Arundo donax TaxID=35708 RepID=A0A0A9TH94_ARUDO